MQHFNQGFYVIGASNTIEELTQDERQRFTRLFIYQGKAGGATPGLLTDNAADIFLGIQGSGDRMTPDKLSPGDPPLIYQLLADQEPMRLKNIIIQGTAGDGVFYYFDNPPPKK
jgi:hypothetical protein